MTRSNGRWMGWTALALALALAAPARAQSAADVVRVRCEPVNVAAGSSVRFPVVLEIASGWHVNANPPAPDYLIPTAVSVQGGAGLAPRGVLYPAGRQVKLGFDDNPLSLYDGTITAVVTLAAARDALDGPQTLRGTVRYQPCNDEVCLAPTSLPFAVEVTVTGGATAPDPRRRAGGLSLAEWSRVAGAIRRVLPQAIARMGTTFNAYRTVWDEPGQYGELLRVYDRAGEPCRRCGGPIRRLVQGGRSTYFCPACQPRRRTLS